MDPEGQPKCGGEGCDGVVTKAGSSLRKAQDTEQEITNAMEEVEKLSKMVSAPGPGGFRCLLDLSGPRLMTSPVSPGVGGQGESRRGEAERSGRPDEDQQNQAESRREQRGTENAHQADQGLPHP